MIKIEFNKFPTHVALSKTKNLKIGTQPLYNGKLNPHSRNKVIHFMKDYITKNLPKNIKINNFPIKLKIIFYAPHNYGDVRMLKGVLNWKPCGTDYKSSYDLDNRVWIWNKVIQDCLTNKGIIPDDTVDYITNIEYEYQRIDNINDRKIVLEIYGMGN